MNKSDILENPISEQGLWKRALLWLLLLGPFFFTSYGFATWVTAQLDTVNSYYFEWEKYIPIIPWTIIPYWSIDLFYGISLFICTSKLELDSHAKRLFTAQFIAVICFLLFPLMFSFGRPEVLGITGALFDTLYSFDKPFNQAPSLHIALLVILWRVYIRHLSFVMRVLSHVVAILILVSVLTTYQHHFIDIPTGYLLGLFCIWLWPNGNSSPLKYFKLSTDKRRIKLALYYSVATAILIGVAFKFEGVLLFLLWPAWSLLMVSSFYLFIGVQGFQKSSHGNISFAAKWMLYPYLIGAKINSWLWTRNSSAANAILDNVYLGRYPTRPELLENNYKTIVDLTAEFSRPKLKSNAVKWHSIPCLDLIAPNPKNLLNAALLIESSIHDGKVLVCCALGYSRSTLSVISWLLITQRASNIDDAIALIKTVRPKIVLKESDNDLIASVLNLKKKN